MTASVEAVNRQRQTRPSTIADMDVTGPRTRLMLSRASVHTVRLAEGRQLPPRRRPVLVSDSQLLSHRLGTNF